MCFVINVLFVSLHERVCVCVLTSAPRRLSEHILQKDSRACWKAGDSFLRHHKQQETKNSHYSLYRLICTPQELWRMPWPLNDWGLDWATLPESLVLLLSHVTSVYVQKSIDGWSLAIKHYIIWIFQKGNIWVYEVYKKHSIPMTRWLTNCLCTKHTIAWVG